jgi:hypothetical protein
LCCQFLFWPSKHMVTPKLSWNSKFFCQISSLSFSAHPIWTEQDTEVLCWGRFLGIL